MPISKDKRTKEEILKLLDHAMEQEDRHAEKIASLETALAECRKKAEDPRHEFTDEALSASKISFRIDYYRTAEKGPLKGIIEHLPTREKKSFQGDGFGEIEQFMGQALSMKAPARKTVSTPISAPSTPPSKTEKTEVSPLLRKTLPHLFTASPEKGILVTKSEKSAPSVKVNAPPFLILRENRTMSERGLRARQPFQIELPMEGLDDFKDRACHIVISVEALEKKFDNEMRASEICTPSREPLRMPAQSLVLEQGVYRITVVLTPIANPKEVFYQESRLVVVQ